MENESKNWANISLKKRISSRKGKTYEQLYGIERAKILKEKNRLGHLGKPGPNKGKKASPETILKLKESHKGKIGNWLGKKRDETTKIKISNTLKGKYCGEKSNNWKGGRILHNGYILINNKEHHRSDKHGYVREHIIIMESYLNRKLEDYEEVHHINENKIDNRIENLMLLSRSEHRKLHAIKNRLGKNKGV